MSNLEQPNIAIRIIVRPGDIGAIVGLHGTFYAKEYGFNERFEAYVAGPLSEFVLKRSPRERLWIAERNGQLAGCIAIVAADEFTAQLRWFLVDPKFQGQGIGKTLVREAVSFCREAGYRSIILWTVSALVGAARLYQSVGFRKVAEHPADEWGVPVVEEKYELRL
jgi:GNAT superfamily N-acetyltransferase